MLYLLAACIVVLGGLWTSTSAWRERMPASHVTALLALLWGLTLAAAQVLPRVGYALPDATHPSSWTCR